VEAQNVIAWCLVVVGMGLQSMLHTGSAVRNWAGFEIVAGMGFGLLFTATTFPVLAPLPVSDNASALSFFIFIRSFFQAWGITIGASVLQNQLRIHLPPSYLATLPPTGVELAYAIIPELAALSEPLKGEVRAAFAASLKVLWEVMVAVAGIGFLSSLMMKELPLQKVTDEDWGLRDNTNKHRDASNAS